MIVFAAPGNEKLAIYFWHHGFEPGHLTVHRFPDDERLVRIETPVAGRDVTLICTLNHMNGKQAELMFFARTAKELGATSVTLVAPYLAYMRQDRAFHPGEAVSARIFAEFISHYFDRLITIDPHLHRYKQLSEIYTIPTRALSASNAIAAWVKEMVAKPLLIGPDEESQQWVESIAGQIDAPFVILEKTRYGDRDVAIMAPTLWGHTGRTPVLVDDMISTAHTMIETLNTFRALGLSPPLCLAVHALFSGHAWDELKAAGPAAIVTCNTISHPTNKIDLAPLLLKALQESLSSGEGDRISN